MVVTTCNLERMTDDRMKIGEYDMNSVFGLQKYTFCLKPKYLKDCAKRRS